MQFSQSPSKVVLLCKRCNFAKYESQNFQNPADPGSLASDLDTISAQCCLDVLSWIVQDLVVVGVG